MQIEKICILGGGSAGWMTAAALSHKLKGLPVSITLVESEEIGTVGVGEATLPHIRMFNTALNIDEAAFMQVTEATFKLGIEFVNWGKTGDRYIHPFGDYGEPVNGIPFYHFWLRLKQLGEAGRLDEYSLGIMMAEANRFRHPASMSERFDKSYGGGSDIDSSYGYAYQFDASLYARYLRRFSEGNGVVREEGKVVDTKLTAETGFVDSLTLDNGKVIEADLFIDCSGFRGVLIEQALKTGYEDWSKWLPANRAWAVPCETRDALTPFTRATAHQNGWQWRIPLQHRTGNGIVYSTEFMSDDKAVDTLMGHLEGPALADPKQLFFKTGRRRLSWNKNVVSIGLAAGFLEPLESTSIHLIQEGITELIQIFPDKRFLAADIDEYNRRMAMNYERVRDFIVLHYVANQRDANPEQDGEMWRYFRNLTLPDSLKAKMNAWVNRGHIINYEFGTFLPPSWVAVMLGQNLMPQGYDLRADRLSDAELRDHARALRDRVAAAVQRTPEQRAYLKTFGAFSNTAPITAAKAH